ncbi:MAG TPA: tetratricopeptide repeat protein [Kofleriaceae bacterium]
MKYLLIVALIALPVVAFAGPKEKELAQKHITKATEAHQAGKYDVALTELQAAYTADPQPDLLYAIGQVYVKLGKCEDAVAFYEKFLATKPPREPAAAAQEAIDTCKAQAPPPPPPEPEPAPPPPPQPEPVLEPDSKPFYTDKIGSALVGAGVVSIVVGVVMYSSAVSTLDDAEAAATYEEHDELVGDARTKRNIGVVFGAVGLAAIGVGVWHYAKYKSEQSVTVAPTATGGVVSWTGRF